MSEAYPWLQKTSVKSKYKLFQIMQFLHGLSLVVLPNQAGWVCAQCLMPSIAMWQMGVRACTGSEQGVTKCSPKKNLYLCQ